MWKVHWEIMMRGMMATWKCVAYKLSHVNKCWSKRLMIGRMKDLRPEVDSTLYRISKYFRSEYAKILGQWWKTEKGQMLFSFFLYCRSHPIWNYNPVGFLGQVEIWKLCLRFLPKITSCMFHSDDCSNRVKLMNDDSSWQSDWKRGRKRVLEIFGW